MQRKWNCADWMLCAALLLFFIAVYFRIQFGEAIWTEGLLFCSEAALVGGIADWFAVKALFDKPLGISYHTRLIPRRRQQIIEASSAMIKREFFSRKILLQRLKGVSLVEQWEIYFHEEFDKHLKNCIENLWKAYISSEGGLTDQARSFIHHYFRQWDSIAYIKKHLMDVLHSKEAETALDHCLESVAASLRQEWIEERLQAFVDAFIAERIRGFWGAMVSLLAQKTELVNIEELSRIFYENIQALFLEIRKDRTHPLRQLFIKNLEESLCKIEEDTDWSVMIYKLQDEIATSILSELEAGDSCKEAVRKMDTVLSRLCIAIKESWKTFLQQPENRQNTERIFRDATARMLFEAQSMLDDLVNSTLMEMPEERFNQLFYEKVADDLTWIRLNGCIIGAFIGFLFFCTITWIRLL